MLKVSSGRNPLLGVAVQLWWDSSEEAASEPVKSDGKR